MYDNIVRYDIRRDAEVEAAAAAAVAAEVKKDSTPEIDDSEIVVDFQWQVQVKFQLYFPTDLYLSVEVSKGLSSFCQWILQEVSNGHSLKLSNGISW